MFWTLAYRDNAPMHRDLKARTKLRQFFDTLHVQVLLGNQECDKNLQLLHGVQSKVNLEVSLQRTSVSVHSLFLQKPCSKQFWKMLCLHCISMEGLPVTRFKTLIEFLPMDYNSTEDSAMNITEISCYKKYLYTHTKDINRRWFYHFWLINFQSTPAYILNAYT